MRSSSLGWVQPRTTRGAGTPAVRRYFDGVYFAINHAGKSSPLSGLFRRQAPAIVRHCCELVRPLEIHSALDLGCGTGALLDELRSAGLSSGTGVDIAPRSLAAAQTRFSGDPNYRFECAALEECGALSQRFDAVLSLGLFDYNPLRLELLERMLACARRAVVLTVPVRSSSSRQLLRTAWLKANGMQLHAWSESALRDLAARAQSGSWRIQVEHPAGHENLWLVARNAGGCS